MTDVNFESVPRSQAVEIEYKGHSFTLAASKFECPDCGGRMTDVNFTELVESGDVTALGLGTVCEDCGSDTLHVAY